MGYNATAPEEEIVARQAIFFYLHALSSYQKDKLLAETLTSECTVTGPHTQTSSIAGSNLARDVLCRSPSFVLRSTLSARVFYQPPHTSWASLQPRQRPWTPVCLSVLAGDLCPEEVCLPETGGGCRLCHQLQRLLLARKSHPYPAAMRLILIF